MNIAVACLIADRITDSEPLLTDPETWTRRDGRPLDDEMRAALQRSGVDEVRAAFALAEVRAVGMELTARTTHRYLELLQPYIDGGRRGSITDIRERMSPIERAELDGILALTPGLPYLPPSAYGRDAAGHAGGRQESTTNRKEPTVDDTSTNTTGTEDAPAAAFGTFPITDDGITRVIDPRDREIIDSDVIDASDDHLDRNVRLPVRACLHHNQPTIEIDRYAMDLDDARRLAALIAAYIGLLGEKGTEDSRRDARYSAGQIIAAAFSVEDSPDKATADYARGIRDGYQIAHGINPDDGSPLF